jgi:NAD(P)H dehydrogenase (quinone)
MNTSPIAITGATGQLGRLVVENLLRTMPASILTAVVRDIAKTGDFAARGVTLRQANYNDSAGLEKAFSGIEKLLLISSNEVGQRAAQHRNVISAAKRAGVQLLVYTSLPTPHRSTWPPSTPRPTR